MLIAAARDFKGGPFAGGDPEAQCEGILSTARKRIAEEILTRHEAVYQPQFRRMALHLGAENAGEDLPTDERVKRVSAGADDLGLQELYFQFARYLLIGSSRPDGLPANLQGIWAAGIDNPWGSKYTINVNTEMNYWVAEPAGLGNTVLPLINLIDMVRMPASGTGTHVARTYYGARGFVIHHNTDLWEMPTRLTDTSGASGPWVAPGSRSTRGITTHSRSTKNSCVRVHGPSCMTRHYSSWAILWTTDRGTW